jgi:PAS domain S-box-containing protein
MTDPDQHRPAPQFPDLTLFDKAPVASLLLTPDGRIHYLNALAHSLLKLPPEPQAGRRFVALIPPARHSTFLSFLKQTAEGKAVRTLETQVLQPDGTPLHVRVDLVAGQEDGRLTYFHLVLTDITLYKQAHQKLLDDQAEQDLQLQYTTGQIRALNDELEHVVTSVIQELHLPTSSIMTSVDLMRQAAGEQLEEDTPLVHIERASQQQLAILQSVKRYLQARNFRSQIRPVELRRVMREVLKKSRPLFADRQVQFTHDPLPVIHGSSEALTIILEEYLANALKYTRSREEARIHLQVQELDSEYIFSVGDNGVGFNMRQKTQLFRLFQRLHSSSVYEGSGLGLAVVRRVAERFGGRAWGEGMVDQGATFSFSWPKSLKPQK